MDQTYWFLEYIKVLLVYVFMMYLWPSVVFRPHLAGKGRAYRFCFCVNSTVILINTAVLLLGLMHILNQILVAVVYLGVFLVQLFRNYDLGFSWLGDIRSVFGGTMTVKRMLLKWHTANRRRLKSAASAWWQSTRGCRWEYAALCVLVLFGMAYFSVNALQVHSYGFGDQYVHHSWIYGLTQGKAFSAGIYPEGMHTFIYLMHAVFRLSIYSCNLFLAGIHIQVYLLSAYLLSRELFGWKMSGLFALVGFLTVEQMVVNGIFGISRLSWTLPQEFALYAVFMSAYGLIRFLRADRPKVEEKGEKPRGAALSAVVNDQNLFIFTSAVAASICIHFYATIIAAFVCLAVVLVNLPRLFRRGVFLRLVAGALLALVIAAFPMAVARAVGYPLQGSLNWAMSVTRESSESLASSSDASDVQEENEAQKPRLSLAEKTRKVLRGTYYELYGKKRGKLFVYVNAAIGGIAVLLLAASSAGLPRKGKKRPGKPLFTRAALSGYLIVAISVFILQMAYRPTLIGLPSLVSGTRVCSSIDMFAMLLFASVLDLAFTLAHAAVHEKYLAPFSVAVCICIYLLVRATGIFHGYLYYELTRYPAAVELTKEITNNLPQNKYTIISTTDELYQVIETGYHEEWIDMVEKYTKETYTIPTPYLFFYIEKHPILYAQNSFASGPKWLAAEKYVRYYGYYGAQYPEIKHGEISNESAFLSIDYGKKRSSLQTKLSNRVIVESRAYAWYEKFSALHPNEGEVIYEDDDILCYCVRQNEFSLFSLGVMD